MIKYLQDFSQHMDEPDTDIENIVCSLQKIVDDPFLTEPEKVTLQRDILDGKLRENNPVISTPWYTLYFLKTGAILEYVNIGILRSHKLWRVRNE